MSRGNVSSHAENKGKVGLDRSLVKLNSHSDIFYVAFDLKIPGFAPREWVMKSVWKWTSETKLSVTTQDYFHPDYPAKSTRVRASNTVLFEYEKLEPIGEGEGAVPQTKVTYSTAPDLGGRIPRWVVEKGGVGMLM